LTKIYFIFLTSPVASLDIILRLGRPLTAWSHLCVISISWLMEINSFENYIDGSKTKSFPVRLRHHCISLDDSSTIFFPLNWWRNLRFINFEIAAWKYTNISFDTKFYCFKHRGLQPVIRACIGRGRQPCQNTVRVRSKYSGVTTSRWETETTLPIEVFNGAKRLYSSRHPSTARFINSLNAYSDVIIRVQKIEFDD